MTAPLPELAPARARQLIDRFGAARLLVVGDLMLDRFVMGRVNRISPEAPVPVVLFDREEWRLGGAANVAHNIVSLGGSVSLVGTVGDDDEARQLAAGLAARGIPSNGLVTGNLRTTTKVRVVTTRNQQVARIDYESDADVDARTEEALIRVVNERLDGVQIVLVSDYQKGVVTRRTVAHLVARARERGVPLVVDPKVPHLDYYRGATLLTPNHVEAEVASGSRIRTLDDARNAARLIVDRSGVSGVLITLGERGMWLSCDGVDGSLAATAREVADVTGAGDTVIATLALAMAGGASPAEAASIANQAAGIVVGRFGAATVSTDELRQRF